MPGLSTITCPGTTLAAGRLETCTATYTTTQADVDAGSITNTGTATGTSAQGTVVTDHVHSVTIPAVQTPAIALVKSADITRLLGRRHPDHLQLQGHQHRQRHPDPVTRDRPDAGPLGHHLPGHVPGPGAFETCTATYTTTQADVDNGSITNTGTATGTPPTGPAVTRPSSVTVPAVQAPAIGIVKSASVTSFAAPGTAITYSYKVTNTGNVTLDPVTVTDPWPACRPSAAPTRRWPRATSETCTATYTTTQADVDAGSITNTGTATGTPTERARRDRPRRP